MVAFVFAVLVAILDTGVMAEHSHFINTDVTGDVVDACGHGTAMAGIVVDLAPQSDIFSVDVQGVAPCQSGVSLIKKGIYRAIDAGATILVVAWNVHPDQFVDELIYADSHHVKIIFSDGLLAEHALVPALNGGYKWASGSSITVARIAGLLARPKVYIPVLQKE